jgi:hypothetical protein
MRRDAPAPERSAEQADEGVVDIGAFCRQVEAHLCRVNGGHLVRIVGPAFELVAGWASEGMPLRVVLHGVDRTIARLTARGPRRRPVRIEFCEADVRDAYEQWRRAVGAHAVAVGTETAVESAAAPAASRLKSLPKHLERVLVRLSSLAATRPWPAALNAAISEAIAAVDGALDAARGARGEARTAVLDRLEGIERALTDAAVAALTAPERQQLDDQVQRELAPYRRQMPAPEFHEAQRALLGDLTRRHFNLPQVRLDG